MRPSRFTNFRISSLSFFIAWDFNFAALESIFCLSDGVYGVYGVFGFDLTVSGPD